jgi:hypothetical protein
VFELLALGLEDGIDAIAQLAVSLVDLKIDDGDIAGISRDNSRCDNDAIIATVVLNCKTLKNYCLRGVSSGGTCT